MVKKILLLLMLVLCIGMVSAVMEDDFNRADTSSGSGGGTATNGNYWYEGTEGADMGEIYNNQLFANGSYYPNSITENFWTQLDISNNPSEISFDINYTSKSSPSTIYIYVSNTMLIRMDESSWVYPRVINGSTWSQSSVPFAVDSTYSTIQLRNINYTTYTYDFYIDGQLGLADVMFQNNNSIDNLMFRIYNGDSDVLIDNIYTNGDDFVPAHSYPPVLTDFPVATPIARWEFDKSFFQYDSLYEPYGGNHINGGEEGYPLYNIDINNETDKALRIDPYVTYPYNSTLDFNGSDNFTIEFLIKINDNITSTCLNSNSEVLDSFNLNSGYSVLLNSVDGNCNNFTLQFAWTFVDMYAYGLEEDRWYKFGVTHDGTTLYDKSPYSNSDHHLLLALDGEIVDTFSYNVSTQFPDSMDVPTDFKIGSNGDVDVTIDKLSIYDVVFDANDFSDMYYYDLNITAPSVTCSVCNETCSPCGGGCTATDLSYMYNGVSNFDATYGDITGWDTSCVTNMHSMFTASDFNQDISGWDTSSVTDMGSMFSGASSFNQAIGSWDTSSVTDMSVMFYNTPFNQSLSGWDTSSVTDMSNMFNSAYDFNGDITNWDTSSVISLANMFSTATDFNQDISGWDTSNVQSMLGTFVGATSFDQDIGSWNTSSVTSMYNMFRLSNFNQDISSWDVSNVLSFRRMFYLNPEFNQNIGGWNTSNATDLRQVFDGATSFDQDLSNWDVTNVTTMTNMFNGVTLSTANYDALLSGWSIQAVQDDVVFSGGNSVYMYDAPRNILTDTYNWTITDGGLYATSNPIMQNVYITPSTLYPQSELVGNCRATDGDSATLDYNYNWYRNGTLYDNGGQNGITSGTLLSTSLGVSLVEGDTWRFECSASDGSASDSGVSSSKQVQSNTAPVVTPSIPTPVYDTGSLSARCYVTDVNGDASTLTWRIYRDTILVDGGTYLSVASGTNKIVTTITSDDLLYNQNWIVSCEANDGYDSSGFSNSSSVAVIKDQQSPVFTYVRLEPVVVTNTSSITIKVKASDGNGDVLNYSLGLVVNGVQIEGGTLDNVSSSVEDEYTFTTSVFNESDTIKVNASVTDGVDTDSDESLTFFVHTSNTAPVINNISYLPELFIGTDDNVNGYCTGTDADGDYIVYDYIWYVNDVAVKSGIKSYTYIGSASGVKVLADTLSSSYTSSGDSIILSCRGNDSVAVGSYVNGSTISVYEENNFIPVMFDATLYGGTTTSDTLFLNATATDGDGQDLRFTYQIVKNGALQTAVNSAYLTEGVEHTIGNISSDDTTGSDTFYFRVRAYDGNEYSSWKNSNTITIDNTAPVVLNASVSETPYENTTLVGICNANDVDDDTLTFNYIWYNGSSLYSTQKNLLYNDTQLGQTWTLSCRAYDGYDYSSYVNSTGIAILDSSTIPEIQSVTIIGRSTNLTGTCLANDYDGDLVDYQYRWYRDGVLNSSSSVNDVTQGVAQSVVVTPSVSSGDTWIFSCKASDDLDGSSDWTNSSAMIVPTESFTSYVDDKTATSIDVKWSSNANSFIIYLDDVYVTTTSSFQWEFTNLLPATTYNIEIQPVKDNYYYVLDSFNETTQITDNNNPTMTSVTLTDIAYTETSLVGKCKATDIESSSIFYTYSWYVNSSVVASGTTALANRDTFVTIPTISTSLYSFNDSVTLVCQANDGLGTSTALNDSVTILNTPPSLSDIFISINLQNETYDCGYTYSDDDSDVEVFTDYTWYLNDVNYGISGSYVNISGFGANDELICQVNSGDAFNNISTNSSRYVIGDFGKPVMSDVRYPTSVVFGETAEISVDCYDENGIANGYPVVRFTNPNFVAQEYPLFYVSGNTFSRYHTFPLIGTYTNFEFECRDGNGNKETQQFSQTLLVLDKETIINIGGGGGGSGEEPEPFRDITSFVITPEVQDVSVSAGSTIAVEFLVENKDIVDIPFTIGIARNPTDDTAYDWMSFDNGQKGITFVLKSSGGLDDNKRFVRYLIKVPDDIDNGQYVGQINIVGEIGNDLEEGLYSVRINVGGTFFSNLLASLNRPLFELPLTATITGAVTGVDSAEVDGVNVTLLGLLVVLSALGLCGYLILRARK